MNRHLYNLEFIINQRKFSAMFYFFFFSIEVVFINSPPVFCRGNKFLTSSWVPVEASPLARPPSKTSGVKLHPLIHKFNSTPTTPIISGMYLFGITEILCFIIYPKHKQIANTTNTTYLDKNSTLNPPFLKSTLIHPSNTL